MESNSPSLEQLHPKPGDDDRTTVDIVAVHGLDTSSPDTWTYDAKDDSPPVNWLVDSDTPHKSLPKARILIYNWVSNLFHPKGTVDLVVKTSPYDFCKI